MIVDSSLFLFQKEAQTQFCHDALSSGVQSGSFSEFTLTRGVVLDGLPVSIIMTFSLKAEPAL
jgi:hypothetical protein